MDQAAMDFHSLTRKELQALCKKNKIPANMTNVAMADALQSLEILQGLDEITDQCLSPEKTVERAAATVSRPSTRRKPMKEPQSTQPATQTRRSTRTGIAESNDGESKNLFGQQTPKVPITTSRSRRVTEPLAQCGMESLDVGTEGKKAINLETPKVHNVQKSSVIRKGKRQEEASAQQVNSSRRSGRLLGKSLNNLSLNDRKIIQPEVPIVDRKVEDQLERNDAAPGTVGEDLSPLLENEEGYKNDNIQHQARSEDSHGFEKPDQDSRKSGISDNVAGLNESNVGCKASDMPDGPPDHLVNNQQAINDVSQVETSEGNFVAEEIGSALNSRQIDLLVSESSDIEAPKLVVASLEPVQDENSAEDYVEELGHEDSAWMDSEVEDNRGLSDDEDQGRLQSENVKTCLLESFEKSSNDSDVGSEALVTKDSAVEANRGLSDDEMTDFMDRFEKSSIDSDAEGLTEDKKVAEDYVEDHVCDDVVRKNFAEESFDDSSLSNAKLVSMNEERYAGTSDAAVTGPENIESDERRESDAYPTSVEDQNEILPNDGDKGYDEETLANNYAMAPEEHTDEHMNIAGMLLSTTEMENIAAEESNLTCNQAPLISGMLEKESPQLQAQKVWNFKTDMHTENEGTFSPRVLAKSDLPQPTQSLSMKQSAVQANHNKENLGMCVKKKENQELGNKSMRCLRKLLAEKLAKLDINDRAKNTEEDEKLGKVAATMRPALQILPDNRMHGAEALGS